MKLKLLIVALVSLALSACVTTANDDYSTDVFDEINERAGG